MTDYGKRVLRIYWEHIRPYRWRVFFLFSLIAFNTSVGVVYTLFYKQLFDILTAMSKIGVWDWSAIMRPFFIIFGLYVLTWITWRVAGVMAIYIQPRIGAYLQNAVFTNILQHSYRFFTEEPAGGLVKKASRFVDAFHNIAEAVMWRLFTAAVTLLSIFFVFWSLDRVLALMFGVWFVVFIVSDTLVSRWKLPLDEKRSEMDSKAGGLLTDVVTNVINVKLFGSSKREAADYASVVEAQRRAGVKSWLAFEVSLGVQAFLVILIELGVMWWGVKGFIAGQRTIGDLALLQTSTILLFNQVWDIGRIIRTVYEQMANAKEMVEVMDKVSEVQDVSKAASLKVTKGVISFDNVRFSYIQARDVLQGASFQIKSREKVALVGSSGAGKSTVTKLLLRLFEVTGGNILIDKQDISMVTQESLRSQIALVPQDPILFHRSLKENIRYARPEATDKEIIAAAKKAHCHEFISALPDGYESLVGERGVKLSGGERQRIAIARAILMDAPILILDEATSSLDSESEALIQDALRELMRGKTVIAIAHRLSTIMEMDRILVMQEGKVVDEGTHNDLLQRDGLYKSLWSIQAGGFLAE